MYTEKMCMYFFLHHQEVSLRSSEQEGKKRGKVNSKYQESSPGEEKKAIKESKKKILQEILMKKSHHP